MADSSVLIEPLVLDPADFPPLPLQPGFAQLVQDELGTAGTPDDGFDAVFTEVVGIVDALDAALGGLANDLLDAFAEADLVDPAAASDNLVAGTAAVSASSSLVDNLGTLITIASTPTAPPTPPSAPPGGGGAVGTYSCVVTYNATPGPGPQTLCISAKVQ